MAIPELVITGMTFPPYSVRGVKQTLAPINAATQLQRTINGSLIDVHDALFEKFTSVISCTDQQPPVFLFPGMTVTVDCVAELAVSADEYEYGDPIRPVVAGSWREDGLIWRYRPQLTMKVISWSLDHDEWGAAIGWTLNLEEV